MLLKSFLSIVLLCFSFTAFAMGPFEDQLSERARPSDDDNAYSGKTAYANPFGQSPQYITVDSPDNKCKSLNTDKVKYVMGIPFDLALLKSQKRFQEALKNPSCFVAPESINAFVLAITNPKSGVTVWAYTLSTYDLIGTTLPNVILVPISK